jgi:hypothetical protein
MLKKVFIIVTTIADPNAVPGFAIDTTKAYDEKEFETYPSEDDIEESMDNWTSKGYQVFDASIEKKYKKIE